MLNFKPSAMVHLLIVDDDEDDRDLFCAAVNDVDPAIHCLMAQNGYEALRALRSCRLEKPDIIFLDLNMPRMNGLQTLTELKKDEALKDIPVIIYSTSKLEEDKEKTKKQGAAAFLTKPTSLDELRIDIEQLLHEHLQITFK